MARDRVKLQACPNCDRHLAADDNYCSNCGQENHTHRLPLRHFVVELLSGLFNFDTKLLRTVKDLLLPPGLVIREYNANKRARYVPPLRIYLFTSVLFFILLAWTTARPDNVGSEIVSVPRGSDPALQRNGLTLDLGEGSQLSDSILTVLSSRPVLTDPMIDSVLITVGGTPTFLNRALTRMALYASLNSQRKAAYVQEIISNFSKLLFLLLPLFAVLLYLFHAGSGIYFTEHLVFALYFHTVVFVLFGIRTVVGVFVDLGVFELLPIVLMIIWLVWAIRTVHRRPWTITILRSSLILLIYFILLLLGFTAAAVIGAFGV